jgi:hypothetical protein
LAEPLGSALFAARRLPKMLSILEQEKTMGRCAGLLSQDRTQLAAFIRYQNTPTVVIRQTDGDMTPASATKRLNLNHALWLAGNLDALAI